MIIGHSLLDIDTLDSNLVVNSSMQAVYVYLEPSFLIFNRRPFRQALPDGKCHENTYRYSCPPVGHDHVNMKWFIGLTRHICI